MRVAMFVIERKTPFYKKNIALVDSLFKISEDETRDFNEEVYNLTIIDMNDIERLFIEMKQDLLNHFESTQSKFDVHKALQEV